jgi:6,7-dimethyl-8-ribityllumazine synthase
MAKFNKEALDDAIGGAAMQSSDVGVEKKKNIMIYDVPESWNKIIKEKRYATFSGYAKAAIQEKMERDGLI